MNAPLDISGVTIKTERLLLRPWRADDLDDLFAYASVDGVGQLAGWAPHKTKEDSQQILERFIAERRVFALEHEGRVVGSVGLEEYDEDRYPALHQLRCCELGYVLAKDLWGRGLMPEAVEAVLRYLFEDAGLDAVLCGHFISNGQSRRVQEKCGFVHYAFDRYHTQMGSVMDNELTILTRQRWERLHA